MDKLISHKAVIDALEKCHKMCCREDDCGDEWIHYETTVNEIECIPSTQQETSILTVTVDPGSEEIERVARKIKDTPVMVLPSAQPDFDTDQKINKAYDDGYDQGYLQCKADQERTTGHWIERRKKGSCYWQSWCSVCGKHSGIGGIESNRHKPFCPNCGSPMSDEVEWVT